MTGDATRNRKHKKNNHQDEKSRTTTIISTTTHHHQLEDDDDDIRDIIMPSPQSKTSKRRCYRGCKRFIFVCLSIFVGMYVFTNSDPASDFAVEVLTSDLLQDLAGPSIVSDLPGVKLAHEKNYTPKHPVIFIPGIISTGLEVWQGAPCAQRHFRQRFWGTSLMIRKILLNKQCWLQHIMLSPNWTDPKGIKLRPAQGLVAADYLISDFWVWAKIIENLSYLGYDESNMFMASYDWRMPLRHLQSRDSFYTRLKANIEIMSNTNNEKVALISHSMGSNVVLYFFRWIEKQEGGQAWLDKYVASFINVGGPLLGVPKCLSSVMSGEMRDTAEMNLALQFIKESLLSREDMMNMFRSFGSIPSMLPKGDIVWQEPMVKLKVETPVAPDTESISSAGPSHFPSRSGEILMDDLPHMDAVENETVHWANFTYAESVELLRHISPSYTTLMESYYNLGLNATDTADPDNEVNWANPLIAPLPKASSMKIYCMYGIGKDTEVAYYYKIREGIPPVEIDTSINDEKTIRGVTLTDGDGTVPLISLGYMCHHAWPRSKRLNPGGIDIKTREYKHTTMSLLEGARAGLDGIRGGQSTADHVDIMGNYQVLEDIAKIVSGRDLHEVDDNICSDISAKSAELPDELYK
eukprot:TRINITY_DN4016_c0_g1_i1.p1 TRINITY_DN4016_c0_g1~~TRINITY_DN4016_c0_g1_i1.p1  ORF type:complete len:637 (+),score=152.92 TRINITY_DN4016_c0_g1_i1:86-1996(+)